MSEEDVARLAGAIATANGHEDAASWAVKVVEAWKAVGSPPAEPETPAQESDPNATAS